MRMVLAGVATLSTLACATPPAAPAKAPPVEEREAEPTLTPTADARVLQFVSTPWTFSTSSFVIEGPTGLVVIDLQFTPSQAEKLVALAEARTKKKVVLGIVLHANPDKFNGTDVLQRRGVRVVTSAQVLALIPAVFKQRTEAFGERYAPDWPASTPLPESLGETSKVVEAGGLKVDLHVTGAGCSEAHVIASWEGNVFAGDLVANKNHAWLELGKTLEWLHRLDEMRALHPKHVHPGRGASGGAELLDAQRRYLEDVMRFVADEQPTMPAPEGALDRVRDNIVHAYPGYGFEVFLRIGLPAEWARQARHSGKDDADADGCRKRGGTLRPVCRTGHKMCVIPFGDGGKTCRDKKDCEGRCVWEGRSNLPPASATVTGQCERDDDPCGCLTVVERGHIGESMCTD